MLRRLLVSVLVVIMSSALGAGSFWFIGGKLALADEFEKKNCPSGFHWERLSGQCCIQDHDTIPGHGKINFDGLSICEPGYSVDGEWRPTTDGLGPPGCPNHTAFFYLKSCKKTSDGAAAMGGEPANPVSKAIRNASEELYDGGSGPDEGDLALTGALSGGLLGTLLGATILGTWTPVKWSPGPQAPSAAEGTLDAASRQRLEEAIREAERGAEEALEKMEEARKRLEKWKKIAKDIDAQLKRLNDWITNSLQKSLWWSNVGGYSWYVAGGAALLAAAIVSLPVAAAGAGATAAGTSKLSIILGKLTALGKATWAKKMIFSAAAIGGKIYSWLTYNTDAWAKLKGSAEVLRERVANQLLMANREVATVQKEVNALTKAAHDAERKVDQLRAEAGAMP